MLIVYTLGCLIKMETKLLPMTSVLPISHPQCSWVLLLLNGLHFLKMASFNFAMPGMSKKPTDETTGGRDSHGFPSSPLHLPVGVGCALGLVMVAIKKTLSNVKYNSSASHKELRIVHNK